MISQQPIVRGHRHLGFRSTRRGSTPILEFLVGRLHAVASDDALKSQAAPIRLTLTTPSAFSKLFSASTPVHQARSQTPFLDLQDRQDRTHPKMPSPTTPGGGKHLFTLPIASSPDSNNGHLTVTTPKEKVYLLTFTHGADNRLTTPFCQTFLLALDILQSRHPPGVIITTSGIPKFYSNGLDLEHANATPGFFAESLYALWRRLLTYPMPTVALINGHAFAGGMMFAMFHDYRIMNPHKGFLCLNEVELGVPLRPPMMGVFRGKVGGQTVRRMVLEGARFKVSLVFSLFQYFMYLLSTLSACIRHAHLCPCQALDALKEGIIDWLGGLEETLAHIEEFALVQKAQPGGTGLAVYGLLKAEMWRETVRYLEDTTEESLRETERALRARREGEKRERKVGEWEEREKAKL